LCGKPVRMAGSTTDITELKQAQQALQESETRFRNLAEFAPVMIYVCDVDGNNLYANQAYNDFIGASPLADSWKERVHPQDQERYIHTYRTAMEQRIPFNDEIRLRHSEGDYRWVLSRAVPRFDSEGVFLGYAGTVTDITEHKLTEEALRKSEERYSLVIYGCNDGIWDRDLVTGESYWNDRLYQMIGESSETFEPTVNQLIDRAHPDDRERILQDFANHLKTRQPYDSTYRLRHADGSYRYIHSRGMAIFDEAGRPIRMSGAATDVTETMKAELALHESELRFRMLADSAPVMIWMIAGDKQITYLNQTFLAFLGCEQCVSR
jgi:PAS domain S-box-containing protein